ncbi:hypothetical protein LTR62_008335 [Meristemomyces frigidus]|uniref:Uncharacterized protein n=1 Tax=Meristemomyces frigidus TaxID=1508187 RepID=A0AAN7TAX3_9PEZI|nr:hypothetical protein LTR62_008335 [Meristemomyces frigidus]
MALNRGIQSALFYYLSCAPYHSRRHRHARLQEAKRDQADREQLAAEMPELFQQQQASGYWYSTPGTTNPGWQAEIDAGPMPPARKGRQGHKRTEGAGAVDVWAGEKYAGAGESRTATAGPNAKRARIERSEEETVLTKPPRARLPPAPGNPAINEMHPPTVTKFTRDEIAWVREPLPTADVMMSKPRRRRRRPPDGDDAREASVFDEEEFQRLWKRAPTEKEVREWVFEHVGRGSDVIAHRRSAEF